MMRFMVFELFVNLSVAGICAGDDAKLPAQSDDNAATVYLKAESLIKADSPAATSMEYRDFPPFPREWMRVSELAWRMNGPVREMAHQARSIDKAIWPEGKDYAYLNKLRNLANNLGDACLYEGVQHHSAGAIEEALDELHLSEMVSERPSRSVIRVLVGEGITASICNRLLVIAPDLKFTRDDQNTVDLNVKVADKLIAQLLDQHEPEKQLIEILGPQGTPAWKDPKLDIDRLISTMTRAHAERTFTAISLACQLYRADKGNWPESVKDLVPKYLPRVPIDPWGNGKQTFGYALIKGGLPDGSDRPLVYARFRAEDGLAYRLDEPQYGFYQGDGTPGPAGAKKHQGQFRDVARWEPAGRGNGERTKALDVQH